MATPENSEWFLRTEALFNEAVDLPEDRQQEWLRGQCGADFALFDTCVNLLQAHRREKEASNKALQSRGTDVPGNVRLGPYEVISLLGRGGMGAVYLAQRADGQYQKRVAIKLVDLPLATEVFTERFRMERQILASLDHPGIARMLDGGVTADGVLYLVMEYVDGLPIDVYCRQNAVSPDQRLQIFEKICKAVQFAHQNLVIHRDLKPENILVSADGEPHLLDFGTAKLVSTDNTADTQGLTRQGFLSFTPAYASPEQVLGKPITTASDTYSLGVLLYLLLTGRMPYELSEFTTEEMVSVICERPPAPPTDSSGVFPDGDLEAILAKALRKEPEKRYQTAEQLAADIDAYREHRPVLARKGTFRYTAAKLLRRNKLAFGFAGVLLLTLVCGVLAVLWQAHEARRAEHRAEARSADLLALSDSLLSELDSAIQQLPGSTGVQQMLVARVLEQLERLSADARNDKATGLSLATAYTRLAALQGDGYEQNLGDTAGALKSLDHATQLLDPLAAASPNDIDIATGHARTLEIRGEVQSLSGDNAGAVASFSAANRYYEKSLAVPHPDAKLCFEAAVTYELLGDVMGQDTGFADPAAAMVNYRKAIDLDAHALELDPGFARVRRGLVLMQLKIGKVDMDTDPALALKDFNGALDRYNALPAADKSKLTNVRLYALIVRKQAVALSELGRYTEALPLFEVAAQNYGSLRAADPKDVRAKGDLQLLFRDEADSGENAADTALQQAGVSTRDALLYAEQALVQKLDVLNELLEAKPASVDFRVDKAATAVHLAVVRKRLHQAHDEPEKLEAALHSLREAANDKGASTLILQLSFAAFQSVEGTALEDPAFLRACAERGIDLTRHKSVDWLLMAAQAYQIDGQSGEAKKAAQEGLALLPAENASNGSFRIRRLLVKITKEK